MKTYLTFCCWFFGKPFEDTGNRYCHHPRVNKDLALITYMGLPKIPSTGLRPIWCPMQIIPIGSVRKDNDEKYISEVKACA